eukprot:m.19698 g.19698  ORF g.19698 m.19698 type:complete len:65 (-) comp8067_c0_seq1:661-855(-)
MCVPQQRCKGTVQLQLKSEAVDSKQNMYSDAQVTVHNLIDSPRVVSGLRPPTNILPGSVVATSF